MYNGVLRTLINARHDPYLKKNLILLGVLDSNKCNVIAENKFMRILKVALVVMKARKVENLNLLLKNTFRWNNSIIYSGS